MSTTEQPRAVPALPAAPESSSLVRGLLRLARLRQWSKNVLVFAAPATAGVLTDADVLPEVLGAFVAFCLVASATYFLNDAMDVEQDRHHPVKRNRPIAAGVVPVPVAIGGSAALFAASLGLAFAIDVLLVAVLATYVVVQIAYSLHLKHVPVVELVAVASGFLLRAVAGAAAVDVPISDYFLVVASFGSLFLVAGKRAAEHDVLGLSGHVHRRTLEAYTRSFLIHVRTMSAAVTILAYVLWALELGDGQEFPWFGASIVPFVLALMRYELLIEEGQGGEPEEVFMRNREIKIFGLIWLVLLVLGVYAG